MSRYIWKSDSKVFHKVGRWGGRSVCGMVKTPRNTASAQREVGDFAALRAARQRSKNAPTVDVADSHPERMKPCGRCWPTRCPTCGHRWSGAAPER